MQFYFQIHPFFQKACNQIQPDESKKIIKSIFDDIYVNAYYQ